ncbi:unnamed protein product [Penicillium roqueforti FM164]|uniref:Genomic scaffold, ProqFM164S01 n=1 Tax=Penicillium roqueforti (strain FM164) TaxID=1365484 RepID=W6QH06_PENRF|nr:unnamed protein product [Penicillium roqueforti FM164]
MIRDATQANRYDESGKLKFHSLEGSLKEKGSLLSTFYTTYEPIKTRNPAC